eukprot:TRINITY_DN720_c0_g2_i1.p1 TRINITY_DN720_c0_g2~~TRINITY_DN720_c0_g2_i1.p1  ORF type:complete len:134 (+),score=14.05 TRINITY_DN720_c0_g2_i1:528-929(+)
MTIIWTSISAYLIFETVLLFLLLLPLPFDLNVSLARATSRALREGKYFVRFLALFLGYHLADALWSLYKHSTAPDGNANAQNISNYYITKFRTERNCYMTGFSLVVLGLILLVEPLVRENKRKEEKLQENKVK